jgi:hypothetical protein
MDPNWRKQCVVLSVGPALQEIPNYGSPYQYATAASKYPSVIFMVVEPGYFS